MNRTLKQLDEGVFTVSHVFSPEECRELIQRAEAIGFEAASVRMPDGAQMMPKIRNNDRAALTDPELSLEMWHRIEPFLPVLDGCAPCGVDPQLRFYRYVPGQQFKQHKDGAVTNDLGQTTKLSYLIYLNDDCEGGSTVFTDYREIDGKREKVEIIVSPEIGSALLFRHERWHEGKLVTSGSKYVLRSDVFYTKPV